ncbi:hypothetical protein [Acinetobacter calcoaceticus]|uniref:hypothetical protein n=1 Tax=Acinetobacter calcoaceticus TaxID=471 RepID=UPI00124CA982|nr:hypothetical protein [Acinetobacter calcoaceticus]
MLDVLIFDVINTSLADWFVVFGVLVFVFIVLMIISEDWIMGISAVVGIILVTIAWQCGEAILSSEISDQEYQEVLLLKKQAKDGKLYSSESNEAILHVIKLSTADSKINNFEYDHIKKIEEKAIKKNYVSKISHD